MNCPGSVIDAKHRFAGPRPYMDRRLTADYQAMVRRNNPLMSEREVADLLRRHGDLFEEAALAIRGLPPAKELWGD